MKCLKVFVAAVEVQCPDCQKEICDPSGSLFWMVQELPAQIIGCPSCGKDFKLPYMGFLKGK